MNEPFYEIGVLFVNGDTYCAKMYKSDFEIWYGNETREIKNMYMVKKTPTI